MPLQSVWWRRVSRYPCCVQSKSAMLLFRHDSSGRPCPGLEARRKALSRILLQLESFPAATELRA